ncbi:hypothetical protein M406DRAFT_267912 [Cryphonectria parasitica EP155]|uniref:Zn(2)-C6 fungal-type domain-containing protein n=1 Tax=Cryphonectria parasitica (strain ATCC 38755 / EP155) TaxID=660469 RepID=A0A9P5CJV8_CRYP1|nr:uncharacterized protein M406DRAFT_267912 [Cryphonectria parasitica EP155]KAF3760532.1 hypothetical protein M406DRAFT_267912 [Cryphonectria parasitica EP155]
MAATSKPRQPRLRASCDGCFLAKVKCSKARPICSRCLTCGIDCRYSPSTRAGKPKASNAAKNQRHQPPNLSGPSPIMNEGMVYTADTGIASTYPVEPGWTTPPSSIDGTLGRSESISSGMTFIGVDNNPSTTFVDSGISGGIYNSTLSWTPPNDTPPDFTESSSTSTVPAAHSRSQSYHMNNSVMGWNDTSSPDMLSFNQVSTPPSINYTCFPSPTSTPNIRSLPARPESTSTNSTVGSCTCFTVCLQSLQALHNASSPTPPQFDLVLSLNRKAVEGCAAMLACTRCMSRSGTHTAAMLLATLLGTITVFYKEASLTHFDQGTSADIVGAVTPAASDPTTITRAGSMPGLGVTLGTYTVNVEDSRWLELEILARELRKLEEVYASFREVCSDLSEDPEVSKAMIGYLGQSLGSTMQVVTHRKGDVGCF